MSLASIIQWGPHPHAELTLMLRSEYSCSSFSMAAGAASAW
jgi:hypothetical protein